MTTETNDERAAAAPGATKKGGRRKKPATMQNLPLFAGLDDVRKDS